MVTPSLELILLLATIPTHYMAMNFLWSRRKVRTCHIRTHTYTQTHTCPTPSLARSPFPPSLSLTHTHARLSPHETTGKEHVERGLLLPSVELHRDHTEPARLNATHGLCGHSRGGMADERHAGAACRLAAAHLDTALALRDPRSVDWVPPRAAAVPVAWYGELVHFLARETKLPKAEAPTPV